MDKLDKQLFKMAKKEPLDAPVGFDARLEAAIERAEAAGSPEVVGTRGAGRPGVRPVQRARPLRIAVAALIAVCVLAGTALAVSPALRELLWGDFDEVAQDFPEMEENTQVCDGVEARLVSAYTDGHILKAHIEFRDTEGDRLRALLETEDPDRSFFPDSPPPLMEVEGPEGTLGPLSQVGLLMQSAPKLLDFDEETGVATVEVSTCQSNPAEGIDRISVTILSGAAGTEALREETDMSMWEDSDERLVITKTGWKLSAPIEALPVREAENGTVRAYLSDIGLTLLGEREDGGAVHESAVTARFSDGTELAGEALVGAEQILGLDGGRLMRIVEFAAPIDSGSVESIDLNGVELTFD